MKEKYLRSCRKITDQFILASVIATVITAAGILIADPVAARLGIHSFFLSILNGDADAEAFLYEYFNFIGIWFAVFIAALMFKANRPMLGAVKYSRKGRPGNNFRGLGIGLLLGFGCNGFCILMSALMGDIYLEYSGFSLVPFAAFFICVFIQSAAEELSDRWYLYQKLRRRYKSPLIAIIVNALVFMSLHLANPGISVLAVTQIFVVGVLMSLFVYYYNGLWMAMAFHTGWNFTQSILFGLPNSGLVSAFSVFRLDAASATNGVFYNVNFGVEGSPGAVAVLVVVGIIVVWRNRNNSECRDVWDDAEKRTQRAAEM